MGAGGGSPPQVRGGRGGGSGAAGGHGGRSRAGDGARRGRRAREDEGNADESVLVVMRHSGW